MSSHARTLAKEGQAFGETKISWLGIMAFSGEGAKAVADPSNPVTSETRRSKPPRAQPAGTQITGFKALRSATERRNKSSACCFAAAMGALLCLGAMTGCSRSRPPDPQYAQPGNLVEIVKDFQRASREDLYRFDIPKDVAGGNLMKTTLLRLDDFQRKYPGRFSDVVQFTRAAAYERLREYPLAIKFYTDVVEHGGDLASQAKERIGILETFLEIKEQSLPAEDPFAYIQRLDEKVRSWNELVQRHVGTPYEFLARAEEERIDRAKVAFVELNRHQLREGNELVIVAYSQLLAKHRNSRNYHRHVLDFGDYYVKLAKEYMFQNDPEGLDFDKATFDQFAQSALKLYAEVAQEDGIIEKLEAKGKIDSLRALMDKAGRLNQ